MYVEFSPSEIPFLMKSSTTLVSLLLITVNCLFTSSCQKEVITCGAIIPVLPQIREAIPYDGVDTLRFRYGDDPTEITARVIKTDGLANGIGNCKDFIEASFSTVNSQTNFSFLISTSRDYRNELNFDFRFGTAGSQRPQLFTLRYDQMEISAANPSVNVVSNVDTTLAGFDYEDVLFVTDQTASERGEVVNFFYSNEFGIIHIARIDRPLISLIQ